MSNRGHNRLPSAQGSGGGAPPECREPGGAAPRDAGGAGWRQPPFLKKLKVIPPLRLGLLCRLFPDSPLKQKMMSRALVSIPLQSETQCFFGKRQYGQIRNITLGCTTKGYVSDGYLRRLSQVGCCRSLHVMMCCPVLILYICLVSTADICPVSTADISISID